MSKQISYGGKVHSFPDDFTDADISAALSAWDATQQAEDVAKQAGSGPARFMKSAARQIDPTPLISGLISDPKYTLGSILEPLARNPQQALGNMLGAPLLEAGEQVAQGNVAGGLGTIVGAALPYALSSVPNPKLTPRPNLNPVQQSAIAYGKAQGIPMDLATRTQNSALLGLKRGVQHIPGAAGIGDEARMATQNAMTSDLGTLGMRTAPTGTAEAYTAGQSVVEKMGGAVNKFDAQADAAYNRLRQIAEDKAQEYDLGFRRESPSGLINPNTGKPITAKVTARLAGRVDMKPFKGEIAPILDDIEGKMFLNIPPDQYAVARSALMQNNPTYAFLRQIMDGPDIMDVSSADRNLSYLKKLARNTDENPVIAAAMRNRSEGLAARAIPDMERQVSQGVADLGKDAMDALLEGRRATIKKYELAKVVDQLKQEPVQAFRQVIAHQDSNLNLLKTVQAEAPQAIPDIARAYLEGLITKASPSGVVRSRGLLAEWKRMGPETKKILFGGREKEIEDAFQLANMLQLDVNPSGTAPVSAAVNLASQIVSSPLTGLAHAFGARELARQIYHSDVLSLPIGTAARNLVGIPGAVGQTLSVPLKQQGQ